MNDTKELINIIKENSGSATIDEIIDGYKKLHSMIIFPEGKKYMENILDKADEIVFNKELKIYSLKKNNKNAIKTDIDNIKKTFTVLSPEMERQIEVLEQIKEIYPNIIYKPSGEGKSKTRIYDICVYYGSDSIFTLNSDKNDYSVGRYRTKYVSSEEENMAIRMLDRKKDLNKNEILNVYKYRPSWTHNYYKAYSDYESLKENLLHIIDIYISSKK